MRSLLVRRSNLARLVINQRAIPLILQPKRSFTTVNSTQPPIDPFVNHSINRPQPGQSTPQENTDFKKFTQDLSKTLHPDEHMNVIDLIKDEHRFVDSLFKDYKNTTDARDKQGIAYNIIKLLSIHAACEEMTIYPFLKKKGETGIRLVDHALAEHTRMKKDLYDLDQMKYGDAGFEAKFEQTIADTVHHVAEEERELLHELGRLATPQELQEMTKQFISSKKFAPSRPHPDAPNEPPANNIANAASVPLDAMKDATTGRFA